MSFIVSILFWLGILFIQPQDCPGTFTIGDTVTIREGSVFDGRPGEVFQLGWFADGSPAYVVKLLPNEGYIGVTGCDLQPLNP